MFDDQASLQRGERGEEGEVSGWGIDVRRLETVTVGHLRVYLRFPLRYQITFIF